MLLYWINLFIIPIWSFLIKHSTIERSKHQIILLLIVFIQWTLLASLRDLSVGWDTPTYADYFESISSSGPSVSLIDYRLEPLYILLNYIVGLITKSPHVLYFIIALLSYFLILYRVPKYSAIPWLTCFLFVAFGFYNFSINILRQTISIAVIIFSLEYIVDRKIFHFVACVIIATLFHYSAIAFIITYPLYRLSVDVKSFLLILLISIVVSYVLLPSIMSFVISENSYYEQHLQGNGSSGYGMLLMLLLTSVFSLIFTKNLKIDNYGHLWLIMIFLATGLQFSSLKISILVRLVYFWQIAMIFLFPYIISIQEYKSNKIVIGIFIILIAVLYYSQYAINAEDVNGTVPYSTFL